MVTSALEELLLQATNIAYRT